jgi:hypothetical protein
MVIAYAGISRRVREDNAERFVPPPLIKWIHTPGTVCRRQPEPAQGDEPVV